MINMKSRSTCKEADIFPYSVISQGGLHQMKFADDTVFSEKILQSDAEVACFLIAVIIWQL